MSTPSGWVMSSSPKTTREHRTKTDEAKPFWVPLDAIPYAAMWEDDCIWLPEILAGRPVRGDFLFESGKLLSYALQER